MKAIILAAGRGSRLHPYTEECPKCLTVLGGISLIERQLETLRREGVDDIVIVSGYRAELLSLDGTRQVMNSSWETTNMVESLFCAEKEFTDDFIVAYSDILYEARVLSALLRSPHEISVVVDRNWRALWETRFDDPLSDAETLRLDGQGRITEIGQPPDSYNDIEAQYIGLMRFRGNGVKNLRQAYASLGETPRPWMDARPVGKAYMTDLLMEMILLGHPVHAVPVNGGWLEVDTVSDFETFSAMFKDGTIGDLFNPEAQAGK